MARGGSKRLPGKNIRILGDKPLIVWSIDAAKDIPEICDILISTDDKDIATVCEAAGAYVPWLRPSHLATDTSSSVDSALHALDWYEEKKGKVDGLLLLQPTSPFRTKKTVLRGIELFRNNSLKTVVGISPAHTHPMWTLKMEDGLLVPFMSKSGFGIRSQDLPPAFEVNGSFYLIRPTLLRERRSFMAGEVVPLLIESPQEALDIDTDWDFRVGEIIVEGSNEI
jgi:N-acylneuraminate cytidylyltransferase